MGHRFWRVLRACGLTWFVVCGAGPASAETASPASASEQQATAPVRQAAAPAPAGQRLRVFLDCDCFQAYVREEIDWVDYVRQAQDADVHVLGQTTTTGGGGREAVLRFVGRDRFEGIDQELRAVTLTGDSEDTRRRAVLRAMTVGLLGYMARGGLPADVDVSVRAGDAGPPAVARDPWNLWVFQVRADGSFDAQESSRSREASLRLSADRVSAMWKISFGARAEQQIERFTLDFDEDPDEGGQFESRRREGSFSGFVARSLSPHWSIGVGGDVESSTYGNTKLAASFAPRIEFSVFPYQDYATRQLVVEYLAGIQRQEYNEVTLFDKLSETLFGHELSLRLDQQQPWGSLEARVEFFQYFHDLGRYHLEVSGETSIRIARGLSLSLDASASRIRDQLSLPKRNASSSEVLLRLRELQSGYEVDFSFGITYSFGALFNNVVNPRFGGW